MPSFPPDSAALVAASRYHKQLSLLQEQLADAQRELALLNQERSADTEHYADVEKALLVAQHKIGELDTTITVQRELMAAAKDREDALENEVTILRAALEARVADDQARADLEKQSVATQIAESERQRLEMEAQLVDRDLELARLRGEVHSVRELKASRSRELVAVRETAANADARLRESETKGENLEREVKKLKAELSRNLSEQLALSSELKIAREEAAALRSVTTTVCDLLGGIDKVGEALEKVRKETAKELAKAAATINLRDKEKQREKKASERPKKA